MSSLLALFALPALKTQSPPVMPDWSSLRQSRKARLDIRPVIWSLRNKPQDWQWYYSDRTAIEHKPSGHRFRTGSWNYRMFGTDCDCQKVADGTGFSFVQRRQFGSALKAWKRWERTQRTAPRIESINKEFRQHFV